MKNIVCIALTLLAGCDRPTETKTPFEGYAGFKFGMSLNDALALSSATQFNPYSLKGCLSDLPIRGCILNPKDNLTSAASRDGIPYGLELAFNKYDKLTDIGLLFERDTSEDKDQKMTKSECVAMHERTIDWLAHEFGKFDNKDGVKGGRPAKTAKGNPFTVSPDKSDGNYFGFASTQLSKNRSIGVISAYIRLDSESLSCRIDVTFKDARSIERWEIDPDLAKEMEAIASRH